MTRKEAIQKIKELLNFKFEEVKPAVEDIKPEAPAATEEKTEEVTEIVEVKMEGEPDVAAMQTEIADLRQKVQTLGELVSLKSEYDYLKKRLDQIQAGFSAVQEGANQTLALVEQIANEGEGEPAQPPKDGLKKEKKNKLEKYFN